MRGALGSLKRQGYSCEKESNLLTQLFSQRSIPTGRKEHFGALGPTSDSERLRPEENQKISQGDFEGVETVDLGIRREVQVSKSSQKLPWRKKDGRRALAQRGVKGQLWKKVRRRTTKERSDWY